MKIKFPNPYHRTLRLGCVTLLYCGLFNVAGAAESSEAEPLASVCAQAGAGNRLVIATFISYDSLVSKNLEETVLTAPAVRAVVDEYYQSTRIVRNPASEELVKKYVIVQYPTVLLLRPDGTEIDRLVGYQTPETFAAHLKAAAEGKSDFAQLQKTLQGYGAGVAARLELAKALIQRARFEESLAPLQWCAEQGLQRDPAGYARMNQQVYTTMGELGESLPAARRELRAIRDRLDAATKPYDAVWASEVFACNDALKQSFRNLDLYDKFPTKSPLRRSCFPDVFVTMVESRRYQEAVRVIDPLEMMASCQLHNHDHKISDKEREPCGSGRLDGRAYGWSIAATEAYLAVGETEKARSAAAIALRVSDNSQTRRALQQAARRALGSPKDAVFIAELPKAKS